MSYADLISTPVPNGVNILWADATRNRRRPGRRWSDANAVVAGEPGRVGEDQGAVAVGQLGQLMERVRCSR